MSAVCDRSADVLVAEIRRPALRMSSHPPGVRHCSLRVGPSPRRRNCRVPLWHSLYIAGASVQFESRWGRGLGSPRMIKLPKTFFEESWDDEAQGTQGLRLAEEPTKRGIMRGIRRPPPHVSSLPSASRHIRFRVGHSTPRRMADAPMGRISVYKSSASPFESRWGRKQIFSYYRLRYEARRSTRGGAMGLASHECTTKQRSR